MKFLTFLKYFFVDLLLETMFFLFPLFLLTWALCGFNVNLESTLILLISFALFVSLYFLYKIEAFRKLCKDNSEYWNNFTYSKLRK